jgi:hypothetical protein
LSNIDLIAVKDKLLVQPSVESDEAFPPSNFSPTMPMAEAESAALRQSDSPRLPPIQQKPAASDMTPLASRPVREHLVPVKDHVANGHVNGHAHPTLDDLNRDTFHRIQTQLSLNQAGLEAHNREIEALNYHDREQVEHIQRMDGAIVRLQQDVAWLVSTVRQNSERSESRASPMNSRSEDPAIDMMAKQISTLSTKVSEVDSLKLEVELLKRKIKRFEEAPAASQAGSEGYAMQRMPSTGQTPDQPPRALPPHQAPPQYAVRAHETTPYRHSSAEIAQQPYPPEQRSSGWAAVNASMNKRPPHTMEEPTEPAEAASNSPKRPKLAPLEPRLGYGSNAPVDRMETEPAEQRRRDASNETYSTSTPTFVAYNSQQTDESWRPESQRYMGHEPMFAKRGGRGAGRPGRPRKHPNDSDMGTPEWEKPEWTGGSQVGPDGWYQHTTPGNPIRGGRAGTVNLTGRPGDPYAHTKKTRTKPVRNEQGILIRKDGQPDMRSQSSAANLRKVHARKEQEKLNLEGTRTPSSGLAHPPTTASDSASASPENERPASSAGRSEPPNSQDRHQEIMRQIFPHGVNEDRLRKQNEDRFFPRGSSPSSSVKQESPSQTRPRSHADGATEESLRDAPMGNTDEAVEKSGPAVDRHVSESSRASPAQTASEGNARSPETESG